MTTVTALKEFLKENNFTTQVVNESECTFPKTLLESYAGGGFSSIEEMEEAYEVIYNDHYKRFSNTGFSSFPTQVYESFECEVLFDFHDRQDMHSHVEVHEEFCLEFDDFYLYGYSYPDDNIGFARIINKKQDDNN